MTRRPANGRIWPTPVQLVMLRAALLDGEPALRAWEEWSAQTPDHDPGEAYSYRLMPQLYRNLEAVGVDQAELGMLKGVYRMHWYQNQLLFRAVSAVLARLHAAGIETLLLKGAGLSVAHYRDLGARPMTDVDILVPRACARDAIGILAEMGCTALSRRRPEELVPTRHSVDFRDPERRGIDLHWESLWLPGADDLFWEGAVPAKLAGVDTLTLCPTDHLLHVLAHGARSFAPMRWVADAVIVLRDTPEIDWERLAGEARRRRACGAIGLMLTYLREELAADVPESVPAALARERASLDERLAHRAGLGPRLPGRQYVLHWHRFNRLRTLDRAEPVPRSYLRYLQHALELDTRRDVLVHIGREAARKAGALARRGAQAPA